MERFRKVLFRLIRPPGWLAALIALPAFALVTYVLATGLTDSPLSYVSYAASFYALTVVCANGPRVVSALRRDFPRHPLVEKARNSRPGRRFLAEPAYRAEVALCAGLLVNLLYAAVKMISGIMYRSVWFGALAGYYLLLSALRYALLHHARRSPAGQNLASEWRRYRLCGAILLVMNQALSAVVVLVVCRNSGMEYPGCLIYVMAMYTFYAVINAVRNVVRFRDHSSPVISAAKAVSLIAALVSVLSLETAMLTRFDSAGDPRYRRLMTGCTGFVVCAIVLAMAVWMIVHSTRQIRSLKQGETMT